MLSFIIGDHLIYSMGKNNKGQLGIGDPKIEESPSPILVQKPLAMRRPSSISCGSAHTLACTGKN